MPYGFVLVLFMLWLPVGSSPLPMYFDVVFNTAILGGPSITAGFLNSKTTTVAFCFICPAFTYALPLGGGIAFY